MTRLQVQEQVGDSSGAPPVYEGRIGLDPILLDAGVMDMVIFRTIFFELLVFFTFTLITLHFAY